jgi:dienelactone hydrolase
MSKPRRCILGILAIAVTVFFTGPTTADEKPVPRFEITPNLWFVGDRNLQIRLVNLAPNQKVTVVGHTGEKPSRVSRIEGVADEKGVLDLRGVEEPGPKTGAPFRILWETKDDPSIEPLKEKGLFQLRAEVAAKPIATGSLRIDYGTIQEPKVTYRPIRDRGLRGEFFLPPGKGPFPGVIVWSGSDGGLAVARFKAVVLAKHGFASLALAYFKYEDLPKQLLEIPLEYFETAIGWMKEHKQVRGDRLAVMGGSRGGELALLLGTMFPDVKAVVAYAPSHVLWSAPPDADGTRPAWTYKGKPLPFMVRPLTLEQREKLKEKNPMAERPVFEHYLKDEEAAGKAVIPVEKIAGPILLITGEDDQLWPSTSMADAVKARIMAKNHRYHCEHLRYEGCGHAISLPLGQPGNTPELGGTPEANSYAAWDSWPKVVKFLGDSLK